MFKRGDLVTYVPGTEAEKNYNTVPVPGAIGKILSEGKYGNCVVDFGEDYLQRYYPFGGKDFTIPCKYKNGVSFDNMSLALLKPEDTFEKDGVE